MANHAQGEPHSMPGIRFTPTEPAIPTNPLACHLIYLLHALAEMEPGEQKIHRGKAGGVTVENDIYPLGFESTSSEWYAEATQLSGPKLTVNDGHMLYVKRFKGYTPPPRAPLTTDCQCYESIMGCVTSPNLARPCPVHDTEIPNEPSEPRLVQS